MTNFADVITEASAIQVNSLFSCESTGGKGDEATYAEGQKVTENAKISLKFECRDSNQIESLLAAFDGTTPYSFLQSMEHGVISLVGLYPFPSPDFSSGKAGAVIVEAEANPDRFSDHRKFCEYA